VELAPPRETSAASLPAGAAYNPRQLVSIDALVTRAALDLRDRAGLFRELSRATFDIAVIGAGITGAGIARDAAMRGFSVALLEARDFAAGTSSRSSKLVHGGIRYLAQGDMRLVREAATERKVVKDIAPHLARPTRFVVTARSRAGIAKFRTGLWTYEKLGAVEADDRHELWDLTRLAAEEPRLVTDSLAGAVVYMEYVTDDGRLTLANVRSARASGAVVANYAEVTALAPGRVRVKDVLAAAEVDVTARVVVNATGPWADVLRRLEDPNAPPRLALSKGVHLVLPRERLGIRNTITMTARDKRGVFVVPRGSVAYLGTTDTFYPTSDYWPEPSAEDVDYLLAAANETFKSPPLGRDDLIGYWSGIRPLIAEAGKSPSEISRRDEVMEGPAGVVTIAGGKLTAFRRMAERIVDLCAKRLGASGRPCRTADEALPGGDGAPEEVVEALRARGLTAADAERLMSLYGSEAVAVVSEGIAGEVRQAVLVEGAATLEDYWVRRSARAHFDLDGGLAVLDDAARTMSDLLGWDDARTAAELAHCRGLHSAEMAFLGARG
jgi:glycerol-3-phosphate dehydrogenase